MTNATPTRLPAGVIHVWLGHATFCRAADRQAAWAVLDPDERARSRTYAFEADQHRFIATRAMVRRMLSRYVDVAPAAWIFGREPDGRPFVSAPDPDAALSFSVSHSGDTIGIAVARHREIGLDVERLSKDRDIEHIARRFFAPAEKDWLDQRPLSPVHGLTADESTHCFVIWALKEAYAKARGLGLRMPLDRYAILPDAGGGARLQCGADIDPQPELWQFEHAITERAHVVAVASRQPRAVWANIIWQRWPKL